MSSRLSPSSIIPVGTQVVLKRNHPVVGDARAESGERVLKKAGSAGEIRSAPMTHDNTYEVHFADGHQVHATRDDLTILRTHTPEHSLGGREITAYEPYVVYRVIAGSHAYGLADEHSDRDERGVYVPPAAWHWSLQPLPQQIEWKRTANGTLLAPHCKADADDVCWWELEKFLRLALKANPTVLEVLFVPERQICAMDTIGERLRAIRSPNHRCRRDC